MARLLGDARAGVTFDWDDADGMKKEIEMAKKLDIPVRYFVAKRTREERFLDALMFPDIAFREMD